MKRDYYVLIASVAQWLEHSPCKRGVEGSNPSRGLVLPKEGLRVSGFVRFDETFRKSFFRALSRLASPQAEGVPSSPHFIWLDDTVALA